MSAPVLSWPFVAPGDEETQAPPLSRTLRGRPPPVRREAVRQQPPPPGTRAPGPGPQSQSFSRGYGSILPTSLIYIVLSTRGCAPWRPDAVMSTTGGENKSRHRVFKGHRERTGRRRNGAAVPAPAPSRRLMRFQGASRSVNEKRELSPGLSLTSPISFALPLNIHVPVGES